MQLNYHLDFKNFYAHSVAVSLEFVATGDEQLWLPTWIAGSYLIREFASHLGAVHYTIDNKTYRAYKCSKNEWLLSAKPGDNVRVSYEIYCHDLSVRTAFVDSTRLFGNFTSLLLQIKGQENASCRVQLSVPQRFFEFNPKAVFVCGLFFDAIDDEYGKKFVIQSKADELFDYPFEIAEQSFFDFKAQDIPHRFFVSGAHTLDSERLKSDVQKICTTYINWLGYAPFDDYTFMSYATKDDFGGLEHINSTALITPRTDLPNNEQREPSDDYQRYLGLISHEYFHAWWVKSVRPDVMMTADLTQEVYTPLLWVFEGFTIYVDDFMLLQSSVVNKQSYLKLLSNQLTRYYNNHGKTKQSVAESSFDTWIKLYRPNENSNNATTSYYNKGCLVALCLDLTLLKHSNGKYRLFDVIKRFAQYAKNSDSGRFAMTTENLSDVITSMVSSDVWQSFYKCYVVGVDELPITELLDFVGISLTLQETNKPLGADLSQNAQGLTIDKAVADSPLLKAGLGVGDTIIAIDGIKATMEDLTRVAKQRNAVQLHAFSLDVLREVTLVCDDNAFVTYKAQLTGDGGKWLCVDL